MNRLIPRLNYDFGLSSLFLGLMPISRDKRNRVLKEYLNDSEIFFVNHARTGLRLLLSSLGLPKGARIGVQSYNCNTVFEAITKAGYKPVFIDVTDEFILDLQDINKKREQIDAIIITHLFGIPAPVKKVREIIGEKPVIEDCAHAFLSNDGESQLGIDGDAAVFSFGNAKFPAIGAGGGVVIRNRTLEESFRQQYSKLGREGKFSMVKGIVKNLLFTIS